VTEAIGDLADLVSRGIHQEHPLVVGIAGGVAAGKSTLAEELAAALTGRGVAVEVVTTDDFLQPNAVLDARGLLWRKGFPETYDVDALRAFVDALRSGVPEVEIPVYSHDVYDVVPGVRRVLVASDVVIIEGVNALSALGGRLDLSIYVDVDEALLEQWFMDRFRMLCEAARDDPTSFYRMFVGRADHEVDAIAHQVWREVNLVNLRGHIAPSRARADRVVVKGPDHAVVTIRACEDEAGAPGPQRPGRLEGS
jgi:type I pantothenate kinase